MYPLFWCLPEHLDPFHHKKPAFPAGLGFVHLSLPGAFFHVGTGGKYPAHNSKFTVDPAALFGASKLMSEIVKKALKAS